jgi:hypothetical protein
VPSSSIASTILEIVRAVVAGELVREKRRGERAPCELLVGEEEIEGPRDAGEAVRRRPEVLERPAQLVPALRRVELAGERADGAPVGVELAERVAAGREQEERTALRGVHLRRVESDLGRSEERERNGRVVAGVALLEALEPLAHLRSRSHLRIFAVSRQEQATFPIWMSIQAVLTMFAVGAALLALWTDTRFPALAPKGFREALLRLVAAFALGYLVGPAVGYAIGLGVAPGVALIVFVLPALVAMFLAAIWAIRLLQGMLYGLRG